MFKNYTDCLFNDKIIRKSQQRFKSDHHEVYTEEVNKIALSSNDDKRLQTLDRITIYSYGANALRVCESEMLKVCEAKEKLIMLSGKIRVSKAKSKFRERESKMYVKEKEKCEMFLKHAQERCEREMRKYMKLKKISNKF